MTGPDQPLHDMNPTGRFSDRAADYVKFRPGYPAAAVDAILEGLGSPFTRVAADVGAGTGISARALGDRGVRVIAVEPNEQMRSSASPHPRVEWQNGTAEATGLDAASMDLVLCAQAFHWFRQPEALKEFARILRPHSRLAIVWNQRDRADPLTTGYRDAIRNVGGEHPAEMREFDPAVVSGSGLFENLRLIEIPNSQRLDEDGLVGRAMSASYVPKEGPKAATLVEDLRRLWRRHADPQGLVTLRYVTGVWLAECRG